MNDSEFVQLDGERQEGGRLFKVLGRRKIAFFLPLYAALALVALAITLVTPKYESRASLQVQRQSLTGADAIEAARQADKRLARVQQTMQTNANIETLIRENDVFPLDVENPQSVIDKFRSSMAFERIDTDLVDDRTGRRSTTTLAFEVAFRHPDPVVAHDVTNALTDQLLALSNAARQSEGEATAAVLQENAERLASVAEGLEAQLTAFRREHSGKLPEEAATNFQAVQSTQAQLLAVDAEVRSLQLERARVEAELANTNPFGRMVATDGTTVLSNDENVRVLKTQLAEARRKYSAEHPDIRRLERQLREAESAAGESGLTSIERAPDNPAYITLRSTLGSLDSRLGSLQITRGELRTKLDGLELRLAGAPEIEKQYLSLQREYEQAVSEVEDARAKVADAELSLAIGNSDTGDRLTLIEAPVVATSPDKPVRLAVGVLGTLMAVFGSFALAILVDFFDRSVRDVSDLISLTGEPPLGVISRISSAGDTALNTIGYVMMVATPLLIGAFLYLQLGQAG
ncbi:MAG: hypothetical protein AAGA11_13680 [Pseudomonadota bacterium]